MGSYSYLLYGESVANVLARTWVAKMEYLIGLAHQTIDKVHVFTQEELDGFVEPDDFAELVASLDIMPKSASQRIQQIRALRPVNPSRSSSS